jgi:two-component system, NarL family, response regulator DevR
MPRDSARADPTPPDRPTGAPPRILLVDAFPERRAGLRLLLEDARMSVFEAASGTEALAIMNLVAPDVAVVDLRVPDWDGLALIRQLRLRRPSLAVLAQSTADRVAVLPAAAAGAVDVIDGATSPAEMVEVVREAVSLSRTAALVTSHRPGQDKAASGNPR